MCLAFFQCASRLTHTMIWMHSLAEDGSAPAVNLVAETKILMRADFGIQFGHSVD